MNRAAEQTAEEENGADVPDLKADSAHSTLPSNRYIFRRVFLILYAYCWAGALLDTSGSSLLFGDNPTDRIIHLLTIDLVLALLVSLAVSYFYSQFEKRWYYRIGRLITRLYSGEIQQGDVEPGNDEFTELEKAVRTRLDNITADISSLRGEDKLRRELIANISHDLRSPLTSVQGYVETLLLKDNMLSAADRKDYLKTVLRNTQFLIQLVNNLFELSKLDAKVDPLWPEPFSLEDLVDSIMSKFRPRAQKRGINLDLNLPRSLPRVSGDIGMLERAISNLVDNAIYYTGDRGQVTVSMVLNNDRVFVSVRDSGVGIPEEDLPHVMERFYRVNKDRSRETGGTGLGLAITKKILDLHHSSLKIDSKVNEGTTVSFDLAVA